MENQVDHSKDPVNANLSKEDKLNILSQMMRVRRFEQASQKAYAQGKIGGFLHLYIGQESVAAGTISLCGKHDHIITAYRCHAHALMAGMNMKECMAELYGKATGCSKGKGGSMHFFDPEKNFWGGHGIVAGQTPLGLGLAFGEKYKGNKGACLCYMGEGAVNQGAFHESLNLAALLNIPVVYIIENNGYSMGTSQERSSSFQDTLAKRAEAYNIEWDSVNGEDIYEVRAKTQVALDRAHNESRPTVLEIFTYRYFGHSVADANHKKYRTAEEIQEYKNNHDPILLWKRQLMSEEILTEELADSLDKKAKDTAKEAVKFAEESPDPTLESIFEDVYWEVDNDTEAGNTGRHFFND